MKPSAVQGGANVHASGDAAVDHEDMRVYARVLGAFRARRGLWTA
jgi:hypothetical protein